jgi:hypothetical protein
MMDLRTAAHILGGEVSGRGILCPGPGHRPHDRSLSVQFDSRAPDSFTVHSFAGDDWRECRDHVKERLGIATSDQFEWQSRLRTSRQNDGRSADKTDAARRIWQEAAPAICSLVEAYLAGRGLELVPELSELRHHPRCPFKGQRVSAMIAPMTDAVTGEFRGVHRTRLHPKDKAMLGPAKNAVVRLSPDDQVTTGLHLAEGIETGIALMAMGFRPLWCTLSAGGMAAFPVLSGVECLTIFADNDASGTGERAAKQVAQRYEQAGCEARILIPRLEGADFADRRVA